MSDNRVVTRLSAEVKYVIELDLNLTE